MKKIWLLSLGLLFLLHEISSQVKVSNPTCENQVNPVSLDTKVPRFSWQLQSTKRNISQSGYEIRVRDSKESLTKSKKLIWQSGKVSTDISVHIPYSGIPLLSGKKYFWQV
ncbi:MAG: alpha-L-rhamnosidase, partial [Chitinophagaceae bacterium]